MELNELDIEEIKANPKFTEVVTENGNPYSGQFMVGVYLLNFENGFLHNDIWDDTQVFPAIQGPGYPEYREKGILTNPPNAIIPARCMNGFTEKEFWENGEFIKKEMNE